MYKLHLIWKYLRKRRIAWVSLVAVTLCTAMVIVVISVMGGWLRMFRESFHGLAGDIIISKQSLAGFPYYEEMLAEIRQLPEVAEAAPAIHTFGLVNIANQIPFGVEVVGYQPDRMTKINGWPQSLYRQYEEPKEILADPKAPAEQKAEAQRRLAAGQSFALPMPPDFYKAELPRAKVDVSQWPGMIVGVGVVGIHKDENGNTVGREYLLSAWVKLTVLGLADESTRVNLEGRTERNYWIVDDSRTKIWSADERTVYVPYEILQKDLRMDATADEPARTTDIMIGAKPGVDLYQLKPKVQAIVEKVQQAHGLVYGMDKIRVQTWEESQAKFLGAVEKEKVLITFLFGVISVVAIFLIFCIFFMIVVEKTRDIGIIKSVGATSAGVAGIFLGYGLAIGIVGGGLGLFFGWVVIHNINQLHEWMGRVMGVKIWDPETYAFDTIPNTMNPREVTVIIGIAILSSLLGALVPAIRAARMNPIEALRWE